MNTKLILAATIACSISSALALSQPSQPNPWEPYWPQVRQTSDDDISFEMAPKGVLGFGEDDMPDIGGGLISLGASIKTGKFINEITLTTGWLGGKETYSEEAVYDGVTYTGEANLKVSSIPFLVGYTFNAPIVEDRAYFFVGGKAGFSRNKVTASVDIEPDILSLSVSDSTTDPTFSVTTGLRVFMDENASFMMGYEFIHYAADEKISYHLVQAGFIFTF